MCAFQYNDSGMIYTKVLMNIQKIQISHNLFKISHQFINGGYADGGCADTDGEDADQENED